MSKKLKAILAKNEADLTAEEKALILKHVADLDEETKTKFAKTLEDDESEEEEEGDDDDDDDDDDGIDEKSLKALIDKGIDKSAEARSEAIIQKTVAKFFDGVNLARKKSLESGTTVVKEEGKETREFFKALLNRDYARAKALTTSTTGVSPDDAKAGITIPSELLAEIYRFIPDYGVARRNMRYLPFSGPGNERDITALAAAVNVYWTGEGVKKTSTQPKFSPVTQTLKKMAAICPLTEEIIEDSAIPLKSLLGELFAEAIGVEEDFQFLAGVGTPWTGILNNASVNVTYQLTAGTANVHTDDLLNMKKGIPASARRNAKYYFNPDTEILLQQLKDEQGRYILQQPTDSAPGKLWGNAYELTDALPAPDDVDAGDPWIIFGDFKKCAILGDKQQIRVKLLEEGTITDTDGQTTINLAEQDMVALRIVERAGYVLVLPSGINVLKNEAESGS